MDRVKKKISVTVNGDIHEKEIPTSRSLLDFLRMDLNLTGAKEGCSEGECGACAVILNGSLVDSCLIFAVETDGQDIRTVEGLNADGQLDPLQKAFAERGVVQCGFCTPGMLMAAHYFLSHNPSPTPEGARQAISGNLCRCTGYGSIVEAILAAAKER